ncbi:sodium/hydrogen exchanger 9B2-like isoform X1 [Trichogramma pretiosum]|uniref:sodium/hydrogen exchanger 9B2-like isoform X1 n=1 Tax=Trichogramma pretiosum TaxID=7493 RepID=UPI0006C9C9EE|nr:sodium/hydrogen exchanger 9B2-like isoform X1 [Trichogramma pretiosum]
MKGSDATLDEVALHENGHANGNSNNSNGNQQNANGNGTTTAAATAAALNNGTSHAHVKHRRVSISEQPHESLNGGTISTMIGNGGLENAAYDHGGYHHDHDGNIVLTVGPQRKRSILHGSTSHSVPGSCENLHKYGGGLYGNEDSSSAKHYFHHGHQQQHFVSGAPHHHTLHRKRSAFSLTSSLREKIEYSEELERSWLYLFCTRCHGRGDPDAWEPTGWKKACPAPFCPSYRKFARVLCLLLLGLLLWGVVYSIAGPDAAPGGPLFGLAALCIVAHFAGWIVSLFNMPALIGMLLTGIVMQNTNMVNIEASGAYKPYMPLVANLRKIALVIILTRAGLDLDPAALKAMKITVPKIGLIPWFFEAGVVAVAGHYVLGLELLWALLAASVVAAVSPAVVVPCLLRLRGKGYGVAKGIPTLIIAIAGIDDAASVAAFGILESVLFSTDSLTYKILQGPIAIFGGLGFGIVWGILSRYVPEKGDPFVIPMRVLMLLFGGLIAVFGSEAINLGGAGPLAVVAAAFVSAFMWSRDGWDIEDNPVATAFEIFWMIFEPILFALTGTQIRFEDFGGSIDVYQVIGCLLAAIVIRLIVTVGVSFGSRFNTKEKIFIALACMAKASVQAALAPVTLDRVLEKGLDAHAQGQAKLILVLCIMSILLTAPSGAILIMTTGPRLLTKTRVPPIGAGGHAAGGPEGSQNGDNWRARRPSIRDISIIDEVPEVDTVVMPSSATSLYGDGLPTTTNPSVTSGPNSGAENHR